MNAKHAEGLTASSWKHVADDPNDRSALEFRQRSIEGALATGVDDRVEYIAALAAGRRVLDLGIVDHTCDAQSRKGDRWLHGEIARAADYSLGIDVLDHEIAVLRNQGFNVRVEDITSGTIDDLFDLIVAGDIIEHLGNPEGLFDAARDCLTRDGTLLVTTPNPYYVNRVWKNWRGNVTDNVDHVSLFWPSGIAELADRSGLRLHSYRPVTGTNAPRTVKGKAFMRLSRFWERMGFSPLNVANTIIYEIRRPDFSLGP